MYCHNCGKQIMDGSRFCRYCGARQLEVNGQAAEAPRPAPGSQAPSGSSSAYHISYTKPQAAAQPRPQAAQPRPQPQPQPRPQPQPQPQAQPAGAMLASGQCVYKVAPDSEFKKFEFGGMPEGTVEIYQDRLQFFKKSKAAALAFGAIGNALSGKGKEDLVLLRRDVCPGTVTVEKTTFRFYLNDGQRAYIQIAGHGAKEAAAAMRGFLNV